MTVKPFLLLTALALTACGGDKKSETPAAGNAAAAPAGTIAYVDLDTLQNNYQYYIDAKAQLEQKMQTYQDGIQQKETALQQMQAGIQQRMQNGQITTEAQYNAEVAKFQKQQEAYAKYCMEANNDMENMKKQKYMALRDSLNNFLSEYNKTKKFLLIIDKAVMLHADKSVDITAEVTAGLNKRYNKK